MSERLTAPVDCPDNAKFARSSRPETFPRCVESGTYVEFDSALMTVCEISQLWMMPPLCVQNFRYALPFMTTGVPIAVKSKLANVGSRRRLSPRAIVCPRNTLANLPLLSGRFGVPRTLQLVGFWSTFSVVPQLGNALTVVPAGSLVMTHCAALKGMLSDRVPNIPTLRNCEFGFGDPQAVNAGFPSSALTRLSLPRLL